MGMAFLFAFREFLGVMSTWDEHGLAGLQTTLILSSRVCSQIYAPNPEIPKPLTSKYVPSRMQLLNPKP